MGYFQQFNIFNPVSGDVPYHQFSYLPEIAWRSRALLKSRTAEQITSAAEVIDFVIDKYFNELEDAAIKRAWGEDEMNIDETLLLARAESSGIALIDKEGLPTVRSISEVHALKACIEGWDDLGGEEFPEGKPYEFFAVLSLWLLADAINWLGGCPRTNV